MEPPVANNNENEMRNMASPMMNNRPPSKDLSTVSSSKTKNFIDRILRVRPMKR